LAQLSTIFSARSAKSHCLSAAQPEHHIRSTTGCYPARDV